MQLRIITTTTIQNQRPWEMGEVLLEKMLTTYPFHVDCVSFSRMTNLVLHDGTAHELILQCESQKDVLRVGRSARMLPRRALVMGTIGAGVASES